ncbi:hypothetical protein KI387_010906, partial [Taxus chinensis]
ELEKLKKEEDTIVREVVELKEEQKDIDREIRDMKRRLQATEDKHQQMISFLAVVIDNHPLITQIVQNRASLNDGQKRRKMLKLQSDGITNTKEGLINVDDFEFSPLDMPHIDSDPIPGLLSKQAHCDFFTY